MTEKSRKWKVIFKRESHPRVHQTVRIMKWNVEEKWIRDPEKSKGKDLSSRKLITRSLIQKITAWERSVVGVTVTVSQEISKLPTTGHQAVCFLKIHSSIGKLGRSSRKPSTGSYLLDEWICGSARNLAWTGMKNPLRRSRLDTIGSSFQRQGFEIVSHLKVKTKEKRKKEKEITA